MKSIFERIRVYGQYYLKADTRHRIHSPFLFELVESVFNSDNRYYDFDAIRNAWSKYSGSKDLIPPDAFGDERGQSGQDLGAFARRSLHPPPRLYELYRLALYLKPSRILELGSCLGVSTLTLALAAKKAECLGVEGNSFFVSQAGALHQEFGINNIRMVHLRFSDFLDGDQEGLYDWILLDGDHHYETTRDLVHRLLGKLKPGGCLLLDDIHWSAGMYRAWAECLLDHRIHCSLETPRWGFIFINQDLTAGHYTWCPETWKPWQRYF